MDRQTKTKLLALAALLILGILGASIYTIKDFGRKDTKTVVIPKKATTPTEAVEGFLVSAFNKGDMDTALSFLDEPLQKEVTKEATTKFKDLMGLLQIELPPNLGFTLQNEEYNQEKGTIDVIFKYTQGTTKRIFYVYQNENVWKISKVEAPTLWWTYKDTKAGLEFSYPPDWVLNPGPLEQSSWILESPNGTVSVLILITSGLPSQLGDFMDCISNTCTRVQINNLEFEKITNNVAEADTLTILDIHQNNNYYLFFGTTPKGNTQQLEELESIYKTIIIT